MKLMHIEALVPDHKLHQVMLYLEEAKCYNVKVSAFKNGGAHEPEVKGGRSARGSQTDWLVAHIKDETAAKDLKDGFTKAGFRVEGIYGALTRAVDQKLIKKTASGTYKPIGG